MENIDKNIVFETPKIEVPEINNLETKNLEIEKFKIKLNFFKWIFGSFLIVVLTIIINWGFKDRAVGMSELLQYDRYATELIILNDNPVKKRMLAQFFANVTPSDKLKCGWKDYYREVDKEYLSLVKHYKSIVDTDKKLSKKDTLIMSIEEKTNYKNNTFELKKLDSLFNVPTIIPQNNFLSTYKNPTMYIQYSNKKNKKNVLSIQENFNLKKWNAPGIEFKENGCDNTIRYFNDEDREIANLANSLLNNKFLIRKVNGKSPLGQVELWINND
ncbi:hypothetical protein [Flavobacterium sp.]|uniref:hypothetical protein n=1 Tax=Flavobacterium sp. TaxID=239 RepID=UPI0037537D68